MCSSLEGGTELLWSERRPASFPGGECSHPAQRFPLELLSAILLSLLDMVLMGLLLTFSAVAEDCLPDPLFGRWTPGLFGLFAEKRN